MKQKVRKKVESKVIEWMVKVKWINSREICALNTRTEAFKQITSEKEGRIHRLTSGRQNCGRDARVKRGAELGRRTEIECALSTGESNTAYGTSDSSKTCWHWTRGLKNEQSSVTILPWKQVVNTPLWSDLTMGGHHRVSFLDESFACWFCMIHRTRHARPKTSMAGRGERCWLERLPKRKTMLSNRNNITGSTDRWWSN